MYADLDLNESLRQAVTLLSTYNSQASKIDWFMDVLSRELCKMEKIERQRLSMEVVGGLIEPSNVGKVIELKLRCVVIGAAQQVQAMIEHYEAKLRMNPEEGLSKEDSNCLWLCQHNLRYLVELAPLTIPLLSFHNLWKGVEPWNSEMLMEKYYS